MANLIRGLSENGGVVFCGVDSTQIVRKAEKLHTTSATCSAALQDKNPFSCSRPSKLKIVESAQFFLSFNFLSK